MPDFSRPSLTAVAMLAIGLSGLPAEAAGRVLSKSGRPIAKAPRTALAKATRPGTASPAVASVELETAPATPKGVWTSGEQERACFRGRRKMWQAGEGWVVKKVNLCP